MEAARAPHHMDPRARAEPGGDEAGPLPGYVWLEPPGKVLHTDERHLEFTDDPPEGS